MDATILVAVKGVKVMNRMARIAEVLKEVTLLLLVVLSLQEVLLLQLLGLLALQDFHIPLQLVHHFQHHQHLALQVAQRSPMPLLPKLRPDLVILQRNRVTLQRLQGLLPPLLHLHRGHPLLLLHQLHLLLQLLLLLQLQKLLLEVVQSVMLDAVMVVVIMEEKNALNLDVKMMTIIMLQLFKNGLDPHEDILWTHTDLTVVNMVKAGPEQKFSR